jgi:two-component system response regulator FixJ
MDSEVRTAPTICIVDDDEAVRDSLHVLLKMRGFAVRAYESAKAYLADAPAHNCQCLLVDMHMPEMTGLTLLLTLRDRGTLAPAVMVTGKADQTLAEQAVGAGALGLLKKPVNEDELIAWVDRAVAKADRGATKTR